MSKQTTPTVPEILEAMAATYRERNKTYGNSYKRFGEVMAAMFPEGLTIKGVDDFNRMGIFFMIVGKLTRMSSGDLLHKDSIHDVAVYSAMLEELIAEQHDRALP